jgi:hypothetical protein
LEGNLGHNGTALILLEQSYEQFQTLGDIFFIGRASLFMGSLYFDLEEQDQSYRFFEEHLRVDSELKFWFGIAEALRDLGQMAPPPGGQ